MADADVLFLLKFKHQGFEVGSLVDVLQVGGFFFQLELSFQVVHLQNMVLSIFCKMEIFKRLNKKNIFEVNFVLGDLIESYYYFQRSNTGPVK